VFTINVPNVLTLLRILLVPVLVVALLDQTSQGDVLAAVVFAIASLTDAIDGYIARSRNAITIVSGVDYFFGLRRLLREAEDRRVRALT